MRRLCGGQETFCVTLLVSLRDDSTRRGKDSPCLIFIVVNSGSRVNSILVFIFSLFYIPKYLQIQVRV